MTKVYIAEWQYPAQGDTDIQVYETKELAAKAICIDIERELKLNGVSLLSHSGILILSLIANKSYYTAIDNYNDYQLTEVDDDHRDFWYIHEREIVPDLRTTFIPTTKATQTTVAKPVANGSFCRRCHNFNEYAVADQDDGKHTCWGCKT